MLPKMSGYLRTFKHKNNNFTFIRIDEDNVLEKDKTIWIKIED